MLQARMRLHAIDYMLWLSAPILQMGIVVFMFRRKLNHEYPYFFSYVILQVLTDIFLFIVKPYPFTYYYGYWVTTALAILASFAVLQEIFKEAFRPYERLRDLSVILFRWAALVVLLVSGMWVITSNQTNTVDTITNGIYLVERSLRLMQCGLVFFLLLFNEYLGIYRRHMLFGIAVGFGIFAAMKMLVVTSLSHPTVVRQITLQRINSSSYVIACLIWLGYSVIARPLRVVKAGEVRLKDWDSALTEARMPAAGESFLESMDRTVEGLLYPRQTRKAEVSVK